MTIRWLGGVGRRACDSCRNQPAVYRVTLDARAFLICWNCRPTWLAK